MYMCICNWQQMINCLWSVKLYTYTNLRVNDAIVRLPHSWSGDSQGQEMSLATSAALLTSKSAAMTQSAQTTIPPYQP